MTMPTILDLREIPKAELLEKLRDTQLKGFDGERVYRDATLVVRDFSTNDLWPCQLYVLRKRVDEILRLREAIYEHTKEATDIFAMDHGLWVTLETKKYLSPVDRDGIVVAEGDPIEVSEVLSLPVLPPIVEYSIEEGVLRTHTGQMNPGPANLINDGMHRCFAARWSGYRINCVYVTGASRPYYAYPLGRKWMDVTMVDTVPESGDGSRKNYRIPEDHKSLFRDFNSLFPGVQVKR